MYPAGTDPLGGNVKKEIKKQNETVKKLSRKEMDIIKGGIGQTPPHQHEGPAGPSPILPPIIVDPLLPLKKR
jgi:hypothetical protein